MNPGILTPPTQYATMPRGLLGRPTPVPMIDARRVFDPDAERYLAAVEAADGRPLEQAVRVAITEFVTGCKEDGNWLSLKSCAILCGARTLSGALTTLIGVPLTNSNFVTGDYNRKTGLVGNASNKTLNLNRSTTSDPLSSFHMSVYVTDAAPAGTTQMYLAATTDTNGNANDIYRNNTANTMRNRGQEMGTASAGGATGFLGHSRQQSNAVTRRVSSETRTASLASPFAFVSGALQTWAFARPTSALSPNLPTAARLAFFSVGESVDIVLLDGRTTTLYNAINAAV